MITRRAWLLAAGGLFAGLDRGWSRGARAEAPSLELQLSAPPDLTAGDRASVIADLFFPGAREVPVLLTPVAEGTAVEVVRGRLTRPDAEPVVAEDGRRGLRFAIPIAAHMEGMSVLRVRVESFVCTGGCRAAEAEARLTLRVLRARSGEAS